jgi:hypothetical protein
MTVNELIGRLREILDDMMDPTRDERYRRRRAADDIRALIGELENRSQPSAPQPVSGVVAAAVAAANAEPPTSRDDLMRAAGAAAPAPKGMAPADVIPPGGQPKPKPVPQPPPARPARRNLTEPER